MGAFIKDEHALRQGQGALRRRDRRRGRGRHRGDRARGGAADPSRLRGAARRASTRRTALAPGAPHHPRAGGAATSRSSTPARDGNLCSRTELPRGRCRRRVGASATWSSSDATRRRRRRTSRSSPAARWPRSTPPAGSRCGRPTSRCSACRPTSAKSLGLPMTRLRCLTPRVGAGFGNKMEAHVQPVVVLLALKARRTVKLILSREEDFETVRARHPFTIRMKTGREARRHAGRARGRGAARRRRLRRRQPRACSATRC